MKDEFSYRIRRIVRSSIFVLSGLILGWGFSPESIWFAGVALGCSLALLSAVYTAWKINKVGEAAIKYGGEKKRVSLGTVTRFSMAVLAMAIALEFPQLFHPAAVVVGLMIPSIVAFLDAVYLNFTHDNTEKRG